MIYFVQNLVSRLCRGRGYESIEQVIANTADGQYLRLANLPSQRVPSRVLLDVADEDLGEFVELGGELDDATGRFVVPQSVPDTELHQFSRWFPFVPEDLDDSGAIGGRETTDGKPWEAFVLQDDVGQGSDSSSTPIVYAMFPVLGCATFLAALIHPWLALVPLGAMLANAVALNQSENAVEAIKGMLMYAVMTLVCFGGVGASISALPPVADVLRPLADGSFHFRVPGLGDVMLFSPGGLVVAFFGFLVFRSFWYVASGTSEGYYLGGFFRYMRTSMLAGAKLVVGMLVYKLLPDPAKPLVFAAWFCVYPLVYANRNYFMRAYALHEQANDISGVLSEAKRQDERAKKAAQNKRAVEDTSHKFVVGRSTGRLRLETEYWGAPLSGIDMVVSMLDLSMHKFTFGKTGVGKTTVSARNDAKQMGDARRAGQKMGLLVVCGKGALAAEVAQGLDYCIKPGVKVAPMEGLDPHALLAAFKALEPDSDGGDNVWVAGSNDFMLNTAIVLSACIEVEKANIVRAAEKVTQVELEMQYQRGVLQHKVKTEGKNWDQNDPAILAIQQRLAHLSKQLNAFKTVIREGRTWFWHPESLMDARRALGEVREFAGGVKENGDKAKEIFALLGWKIPKFTKDREVYTIHPQIFVEGSGLNKAVAYFKTSWATTHEEARSSYLMNFDVRLNPLIQADHLNDGEEGGQWSRCEHGVDVTEVFRGAFIGVDLNVEKLGLAARSISILLLGRVYSYMKKRAGTNWSSVPGETQMMLMMDECHLLVTQEIIDLSTTCRSLGCALNFLSQDVEGMHARLGDENVTRNFLNQFNNLMVLDSSPATYKYIEERVGQALVIQPVAYQQGIDYGRGLRDYARNPINIDDHPNRTALLKLKHQGFGKIINERVVNNVGDSRLSLHAMSAPHKENRFFMDGDVNDWAKNTPAYIRGRVGNGYVYGTICDVAHMQARLTGTAGRLAFVVLQRAGAPRVDFVTTVPVNPGDVPPLEKRAAPVVATETSAEVVEPAVAELIATAELV